MPRLLIVDDNRKISESLTSVLSMLDYQCRASTDTAGALAILHEGWPDVVLLDIMLGAEDGTECLRAIHAENPGLPVIMITGFATIENAVLSMKLGAFDFIQKPLNLEHLRKILDNAVKLSLLQGENSKLKARLGELEPGPTFRSGVMQELFLRASRVAPTELPVLVRGETGTGKELMADFIHAQSARKDAGILKINCAAFPESLLDNELFGHERGSYTGAVSEFRGIFERAHGGTLFLDEIGDMPLPIQAKILRVLQNSELRRIGGTQTIKVDVRFVAATNKHLEAMIAAGSFREDLFFRLNAITLSMPALRDRPEDIPALVERFLAEFGEGKAGSGKQVVSKQVSAEAAEILQAYSWPGNIRELRNAIMYGCAMSRERIIGVTDLPPSLRAAPFQSAGSGTIAPGFGMSHSGIHIESERQPRPATGSAQIPESSKYGLDPRSVAEAEVLRSVLASCGYNKKRCAEILRMSRNTLYRKLAQYGIQDQGKGDD